MNVVTWASTSASVSFCEAATSDAMLARTIIRRETGADVSAELRPCSDGRTQHADDVPALDVRLGDGLLALTVDLARDRRLGFFYDAATDAVHDAQTGLDPPLGFGRDECEGEGDEACEDAEEGDLRRRLEHLLEGVGKLILLLVGLLLERAEIVVEACARDGGNNRSARVAPD
jgi:hypothetical protein